MDKYTLIGLNLGVSCLTMAVGLNFSPNFSLWQGKTINSYSPNYFSFSPVFAQSLSPEKVAEIIYEKMPDFPLENNYSKKETGEKVAENTLVTRIVRYHQYTKARPTRFRLDWKLTLADYLGKNEIIVEERYPGYSTLQQNPLSKDREVISNLTMKQRQQLVDLLVSIYLPPSQSQNNSESTPKKTEDDSNQSPSQPPSLQLPQRGGAELLLP